MLSPVAIARCQGSTFEAAKCCLFVPQVYGERPRLYASINWLGEVVAGPMMESTCYSKSGGEAR